MQLMNAVQVSEFRIRLLNNGREFLTVAVNHGFDCPGIALDIAAAWWNFYHVSANSHVRNYLILHLTVQVEEEN